MISSRTGLRAVVAALTAGTILLSFAGCKQAPQIIETAIKTVPDVPLPPAGWTAQTLQQAAEGLETTDSQAARAEASKRLKEALLDIPCTYGADNLMTPSFERLRDEVESRADQTADIEGLDTVHLAYVTAGEEMDQMTDTDQAMVVGMFTLGTYCTLDGALSEF